MDPEDDEIETAPIPEREEEAPDETAEDEDEASADDDAADEETEESEDSEEEDDEDAGEDGLPKGVRTRIAKVTAKRRAAEARAKEAEAEAERLRERAENPRLYVTLAERHGILPDLLGAREAKGLHDLDAATRTADALRDTLEELEDSGETETEIGGRTVTRAQLRKSLRDAERNRDELRETFGDAAKRLRKRTLELIKLGLAAEKTAKGAQAKGPKPKAKKSGGDPGRAARVGRGDVSGLGAPRRPRGDESPEDHLNRLILAGIRSRQG